MPVTLSCGDSTEWHGTGVDLVLTNPYAPLPECVRHLPMILTDFAERKTRCERYAGGDLLEIGAWGSKRCNRVWVRHLPIADVRLDDLVQEEFRPGRGWFPLDLPLRLLGAYGRPGMTVWDGFMGRGTVGKACQLLRMNFIGVDKQPERVALAREYLGC